LRSGHRRTSPPGVRIVGKQPKVIITRPKDSKRLHVLPNTARRYAVSQVALMAQQAMIAFVDRQNGRLRDEDEAELEYLSFLGTT
jgi:hypothetical protein